MFDQKHTKHVGWYRGEALSLVKHCELLYLDIDWARKIRRKRHSILWFVRKLNRKLGRNAVGVKDRMVWLCSISSKILLFNINSTNPFLFVSLFGASGFSLSLSMKYLFHFHLGYHHHNNYNHLFYPILAAEKYADIDSFHFYVAISKVL